MDIMQTGMHKTKLGVASDEGFGVQASLPMTDSVPAAWRAVRIGQKEG